MAAVPVEITRVLEFDAAHRVLGHEGRCKHLHGHRYRAEVTVHAAALDPIGRVIDFSVVKRIVGGWIDEFWDHNIILHPEDPLVALYDFECHDGSDKSSQSVFAGKRPYVMSNTWANPTVENMAAYLYNICHRLLVPDGVLVSRVRLYETPNCWADYPPFLCKE